MEYEQKCQIWKNMDLKVNTFTFKPRKEQKVNLSAKSF